MTHEQALLKLGEASARALEQELVQHIGEEELGSGACAAVAEGGAVDLVPLPAVATRIALAGGAGDLVLALGEAGARRLATAIAGGGPAKEDGGEALDLAALGQVAARAAAAAAAAACARLGLEGQAAQPETLALADRAAVEAMLGAEVPGAVVSTALVIAGEPGALLLRVPGDLLQRAADAQAGAAGNDADPALERAEGVQADSLRRIPVKLWAELGRFRMEVGRAVALAPGSVVEIDTEVDDPIDVFVNGRRLGTARLLVGAEGEWAIRLEELIQPELQRVSAELDSSR